MIRETGVQSKVESYQSLKKWYLKPFYLLLSIVRYGSRVKWRNPVKRVESSFPPLHLGVVGIKKAAFGSPTLLMSLKVSENAPMGFEPNYCDIVFRHIILYDIVPSIFCYKTTGRCHTATLELGTLL